MVITFMVFFANISALVFKSYNCFEKQTKPQGNVRTSWDQEGKNFWPLLSHLIPHSEITDKHNQV